MSFINVPNLKAPKAVAATAIALPKLRMVSASTPCMKSRSPSAASSKTGIKALPISIFTSSNAFCINWNCASAVWACFSNAALTAFVPVVMSAKVVLYASLTVDATPIIAEFASAPPKTFMVSTPSSAATSVTLEKASPKFSELLSKSLPPVTFSFAYIA